MSRRRHALAPRAADIGASATGARAVGAMATGAAAVGALAIARLAVKRMVIGASQDQGAEVGRLRVRELEVEGSPRSGASGETLGPPD